MQGEDGDEKEEEEHEDEGALIEDLLRGPPARTALTSSSAVA